MDPPPLPLNPTTVTNPTSATTSPTQSPRSRHGDSWDQPLPPVPGAKLRLMCSYGGHIIPRPHDKSLCYVGGDTRVVVVDRHSSLSDLSLRLSRTLFHGRHFTLKYQLPNEDLDSLVSVTTDEDLENMIDEYDRTTSASPLRPSRLRLFLFLAKPETATSMGSLLDDAKSETWFVDALNGAAFLPRGLSESAAIDNLLELDGIVNSDSCTELDGTSKEVKNNNVHDVMMQLTMPDSHLVETSSSFGSSSSSPSMSNLPPIKVRVEDGGSTLQDQMVGLDEQSDPPPLPVVICAPAALNPTGEKPGRVFSDDEKSDHGAPSGFRKPPLPLQPVQRKLGHDAYNLPSPDSKHAGVYNLASPDSVASDNSIASATSLSKHTLYQDPTPTATRESTRAPASVISPTNNISDPTPQVQDSLYMPPQQQQQQQHFFHTGTHYIRQPGTGPVPISSYYPMYTPPSQQSFHQQIDQQYQMYLMHVPQNQPYNHTMQSNTADGHTLNPSLPTYKETPLPPYPTKIATPNKPEMAASLYQTAAAANATMVPIQSNQFQQQYVNLSQMNLPSQSTVTANYGFEYGQPTHDQVYYTQHSVALLPPQYQTMTPATAVMLSQASAQKTADNTKQQLG